MSEDIYQNAPLAAFKVVGICVMILGLVLITAFLFAGILKNAPGLVASPSMMIVMGIIFMCIPKKHVIKFDKSHKLVHMYTEAACCCCSTPHSTFNLDQLTSIKVKISGFTNENGLRGLVYMYFIFNDKSGEKREFEFTRCAHSKSTETVLGW